MFVHPCIFGKPCWWPLLLSHITMFWHREFHSSRHSSVHSLLSQQIFDGTRPLMALPFLTRPCWPGSVYRSEQSLLAWLYESRQTFHVSPDLRWSWSVSVSPELAGLLLPCCVCLTRPFPVSTDLCCHFPVSTDLSRLAL